MRATMRFFRKTETTPADAAHTLVVEFEYGTLDPTPLFQLESRLEQRLRQSRAGVYDGNQMAPDGSSGQLQVRGDDANFLLETLQPVFERSAFLRGARVRLRYGPDVPGIHEKEIILAAD